MNKRLISLVFSCLFVPSLYAVDLDALITDAVRYANTSEKHEAKVSAREELKEHMPEAFRAAMQYVHGDNVMLKVLLMEWVNQLPSQTIVPALLDFVDHDREETRRHAIFFLGFYDVPEHAERITPYLNDDRCRGVTIRTLGKWRVSSARTEIEKWLSEGKERVRIVSANALRDMGDPGAIPALIDALGDPVFTVRNTAARAMISFETDSTKNLFSDFPEKPRTFDTMRQRCLADLGAIAVDDVLSDGVVVEGKFFIP